MRIIPRVLAVVLMLTAMFLLIKHVRGMEEAETIARSQLVTYYFAILGLGAVTAFVFCVSFLPLLGEFLGNFVFTPNERIERNPHAEALSKIAAGDFAGAVEEYRAVYDDNQDDLLAATEIARIYCEKLNDPESAMAFLVEAHSLSDRSPEDDAFLSNRLVDVLWLHMRDGIRARAILIKIAEDMPETREAANALHRLQEIDRIMNEQYFEPLAPTVAAEPAVDAGPLQGAEEPHTQNTPEV